MVKDAERRRLQEAHATGANSQPWYRWGPYLSERQWGTVREDYSPYGNAWDFLSHEQARSHTYRWGEDGLMGISDDQQQLCFALALWNEADPILKERLFGLTNSEGNHGEDVKEYYFFLDNTPTHSYMKALYKYPQREFPYRQLIEENARRTRSDPEYELADTGIFAEQRYFDVTIEYAKDTPDDVLIRLTVVNRGPETAAVHVLPTVWFRNTWSWGYPARKPDLRKSADGTIELNEPYYGRRWLYCQHPDQLLFTENETNNVAIWGTPNTALYCKNGIENHVVGGLAQTVNPLLQGTK